MKRYFHLYHTKIISCTCSFNLLATPSVYFRSVSEYFSLIVFVILALMATALMSAFSLHRGINPEKPSPHRTRIAFIIQNEGRGHMTQALTLKKIFESAGHEVVGAIIGRTPRRNIPAFFSEAFARPIFTFESPSFITDAQDRSIRVGATIWTGLKNLPTYWHGLSEMNMALERLAPDIVFNFFDFMTSFYQLRFRPRFPIVSIANQFLIQHPDTPTPNGLRRDRAMMQVLTWVSAWGSKEKWGLSPIPLPNMPARKLKIMPPLLRQEVKNLHQTNTEDFILAYVVNNGYAEELCEWHKNHLDLPVHCFWDRQDVPDTYQPHPNFTFHRIDHAKYLDLLNRCRGIAGTAGFQTMCEAMYLKKPFLVVPVGNQYEQKINAQFIAQVGIGKEVPNLHLDWFLNNEDVSLKRAYDLHWLEHEEAFLNRLLDLTTSSKTSHSKRGFRFPKLRRQPNFAPIG